MIGADGRMTEEAGERFAGLTRRRGAGGGGRGAARARALLRAEEPYTHSVPFSHRSGERIEPLISLQWFCRMDELADAGDRGRRARRGADRARRSGSGSTSTGCARSAPGASRASSGGGTGSRSGTATPARRPIVAEEPPERCGACGGELRQEEDVLDTWFSSALWPFATLGWPDDTPELRAFYPTSFLTTAREILFLWVARMIMMGIEFAGDDPLPRRLRPLGDPGPRRAADVEEPRHRDRPARGDRRARRRRAALRPAGDVLDPGRALLRRQGPAGPRPRQQALERVPADPAERRPRSSPAPRPLARRGPLDPLAAGADDRLGDREARGLRLRPRAPEAYAFFWSELCDWYLEIVKPRLYDGEAEVSATLLWALERVLALLHPMMPFVTEEIWSYHPARDGHLAVHPFPEADEALLDADGRARRSRAGSS